MLLTAITFLMVVCLSADLSSGGVLAGLDSGSVYSQGSSFPDLKYFYIESEHFRIIYPQGRKRIAEKTAAYAEPIYNYFSTLTGIEFSRKIDIILDVSSDRANGFVRLGPDGYYIKIRPVIIHGMDVYALDWYTDWYRMLLVHEIAHVFHLEPASGLPLLLRKIFGHIIYPNSSTPPFYIEGFATFMESSYMVGEGRLNAPITSLYMWSLAERGSKFPLDRALSDLYMWPGWVSKYIYGGEFVRWLVDEYGMEKLFNFNEKTASLPFLCWPLGYKNVFSSSIKNDWKRWLDVTTTEVGKTGFNIPGEYKMVSRSLGFVYGASISPSGRMVAYSLDPVEGAGGLYLYDLERMKRRLIKSGIYPSNIRFLDENTVGYIRTERYRNVYEYSDIYVYDLIKGKEKRITNGKRIIAFSNDKENNYFLAIQVNELATGIVEVLPGGEVRELVGANELPPEIIQIDEVSISPDGHKVAFSLKVRNGRRNVWIVNFDELRKGRFEPLKIIRNECDLYRPVWLNNVKLLMVKAEAGYGPVLYNIESGEMLGLSELGEGIFEIGVSLNDRIVVCAFTADGSGVFILKENFKNYLERVKHSYVVKSEDENRKGGDVIYRTEVDTEGDVKVEKVQQVRDLLTLESCDFAYDFGVGEEKKFLNTGWLLPAFWLPFYAGNGVALGIGPFMTGYDVLGRNLYQAAFVYDIFDQTEKVVLNYIHKRSTFLLDTLFTAKSGYPAFSGSLFFAENKSRYSADIHTGFIYENGLYGFLAGFNYNSEMWEGDWIGPERGIRTHLIYYQNISNDIFGFWRWSFDVSQRMIKKIWFNTGFESAISSSLEYPAFAGPYAPYLLLPLNGIRWYGYDYSVGGNMVFKYYIRLMTKLFFINRGFVYLPIYLNRITGGLYSEATTVMGQNGVDGYVWSRIDDLVSDPHNYIKSSVGFSLRFDLTAGYTVPLFFEILYAIPLHPSGIKALYFNISGSF